MKSSTSCSIPRSSCNSRKMPLQIFLVAWSFWILAQFTYRTCKTFSRHFIQKKKTEESCHDWFWLLVHSTKGCLKLSFGSKLTPRYRTCGSTQDLDCQVESKLFLSESRFHKFSDSHHLLRGPVAGAKCLQIDQAKFCSHQKKHSSWHPNGFNPNRKSCCLLFLFRFKISLSRKSQMIFF